MPVESSPPADGLLAEWMKRVFGASWKTGLTGLIAVAAGVVLGVNAGMPDVLPQIVVVVAGVVGPIVGGAGLMLAKDGDVSGGKIPSA